MMSNLPKRHPFPVLLGLLAMIVLAVGLSQGPASASGSAGPPDATTRASAQAKRVIAKVRACTNRRRIKHGQKPLDTAKPLALAAGLLAKDMMEHGYFGHIDHKGRDVSGRVAQFAPKSRYLPLGENIAAGYGAKGSCKGWMKSPPHRANMLSGKYTVFGVGFADGGKYGTYFVQVFGRGPHK